MRKDYYVVLGVAADATDEQIKLAYRQQARQSHPDQTGSESESFQEVQEAFAVLGEPTRRRAYDEAIRRARQGSRPGTGVTEPLRGPRPPVEPFAASAGRTSLGDISLTESFHTCSPSFEEVFDRLSGNFSAASRPKGEHLQGLEVEITLTPQQAVQGGHARVMIPAQADCPACGGQGRLETYECWRCAGHGTVTTDCPVPVAFPPGIPGSYTVRVALDPFGIHNLYLAVHFRVSESMA